MGIKIERVEKLDKLLDEKVHARAELASRHLTEALVAFEEGKNPRIPLLRVASTLSQLAVDADRVSEKAQKAADAAYEGSLRPEPRALKKARKARKAKTAKRVKKGSKK